MSAPDDFTGERFLPECTGEIWAEHWHRYLFAAGHVDGLDVLDIASGEGYGSSLLAARARSVTGVDVDAPTVDKANNRYGAPNLRFATGSVSAIPVPDASFDCVVSFETLEHVAEQEEMLAEIRRVLRPRGFAIISTPNRVEYSDKRGFQNEFHVRELDGAEFRALLARHFPAQQWYGQRLLFNSGMWPLAPGAGSSEVHRAEWVSVGDCERRLPDPMYFVAFAAASPELLPVLAAGATLLADPEDSIYREYESTVSRALTVERHLADRERIVVERDRQIASLDEQKRVAESLVDAREAVVRERDDQIAMLDRQKRQAEDLVAERERVIVERDRDLESLDRQKRDAERTIAERDRQLAEVNARAAQAGILIAEREQVIVARDAELAGIVSRMAEAERLIAERERIVAERDEQLAALDAQKHALEALVAQRERLVVERDGQLAALDAQKSAAERLIAERERLVVERDAQLVATNERAGRLEALVVERDAQLAATNDRMSLAERVIAEREATLSSLSQQLADGHRRIVELQSNAQSLAAANAALRTEVARRAGWRWWLSLPLRRLRGPVPTSIDTPGGGA